MKTAIYLRLSSADEKSSNDFEYNDSNSIKNQRDLLTGFIKNHADLCETEVMEICDDGFSGANFDRPGMKRLLELVKNGGVNCIIVKDFSRFGRNYIESGNYIEQIFPSLGVRFISVNDGYDSSAQDISAGNLNVVFLNLIHDLYSKDLSVKVKTAQRQKWEKGENIASSPIFGYAKSPKDKHLLIPDKDTADIVRLMFDMAANGNDTTEITRTLNGRNIATPNEYKRKTGCKRDWKWKDLSISNTFWTVQTVYRIITDERYTGKAIYGKWRNIAVGNRKQVAVPKDEWVVKENAFEALVSKDIFIKAQKALHKCNKTSKPKTSQRRKIYCGGCGRVMQKYYCKNPVFICKTPQYIDSPGCFHGKILESKINNIVCEVVRRQIEIFTDYGIQRENKTELQEKNRKNISVQIQESQKSLQVFERERISLYEKYKDEKITRENYLPEREKLNAEINNLENRIKTLELEFEKNAPAPITQTEQKYMQFADVIETIEPNTVWLPTQEMIDSLIDSIIVHDDNRIEINLKIEDENLPIVNNL